MYVCSFTSLSSMYQILCALMSLSMHIHQVEAHSNLHSSVLFGDLNFYFSLRLDLIAKIIKMCKFVFFIF